MEEQEKYKEKVVGKRVLILLDSPDEKIGVLEIPEDVRQKTHTGTVVAVGKAVEEVAIGEKVLYNKYGGTEVTLSNKKFIVAAEDEILLIL